MHDEPHGWDGEYDYIVVGSGAGGGPVASNLARAGYSVALLEAGGAEETETYKVPAFYTSACDDPTFRWDFIVKHYDDPAQQDRDSKAIRSKEGVGVWYPRAGTLGGCTAHHALITIRPHDSDWDKIAELTGDASWRASAMRRYFTQIERCTYLEEAEAHPGGHGFRGWLWTSIPPFRLLFSDCKALRIVLRAVRGVTEGKFWHSLRYLRERWRQHRGRSLRGFALAFLDPNDDQHPSFEREGIFYVPFSTKRGERVSMRNLLKETQRAHPEKLTVRIHALVTRVLFAPTPPGADASRRAIGVELMEGESLYRADPRADDDAAEPPRRRLCARREVILCGGAFNSPQLLMLSGIGDPAELKPHKIDVVVDLPGVGRNLQDRYEVGVVCRTHGEFALTRDAKFRGPLPGEAPDPLFAQWLEGKGPYTTNGGLVALTKRSGLTPEPDLFIFCVPGDFHGYYRGRTHDNAYTKSRFSWVILKSHTTNRDGRVRLRSADPREPPDISFRYFHEGSPGWEGDVDAVAHAVEFVRHLNAKLTCILAEETVPGADVTGDRLRRFIRDEAWGHHASCSNRMGKRGDKDAVVDNEFRVIKTSGLRVVDASVFPNIPGFFISTAIYMIAEKASELIVADAARGQPPPVECVGDT